MKIIVLFLAPFLVGVSKAESCGSDTCGPEECCLKLLFSSRCMRRKIEGEVMCDYPTGCGCQYGLECIQYLIVGSRCTRTAGGGMDVSGGGLQSLGGGDGNGPLRPIGSGNKYTDWDHYKFIPGPGHFGSNSHLDSNINRTNLINITHTGGGYDTEHHHTNSIINKTIITHIIENGLPKESTKKVEEENHQTSLLDYVTEKVITNYFTEEIVTKFLDETVITDTSDEVITNEVVSEVISNKIINKVVDSVTEEEIVTKPMDYEVTTEPTVKIPATDIDVDVVSKAVNEEAVTVNEVLVNPEDDDVPSDDVPSDDVPNDDILDDDK